METQSALYRKIQSTYHFTDFEMQRMKYTISVFHCEFSKLLILGIAFYIFGYFPEYIVLMLTLIPIRRYSGGIHFNHYSSCFLFTAFFFIMPVVLNSIVLPYVGQLVILALSAGVTYLAGPVTSTKRPPMKYKKYREAQLVSTAIVVIWFFIFAIVRVFPYENLCFWVITLQTIQLICAKIARKGDIYEKAE